MDGMLILWAVIFVPVAVWLYALVDAIRTPDDELRAGTRLIWVLVTLLGNFLGALLYLALGRPRR